MKKIFCFGDSITRGESDALHGGWVDRLKTLCLRRSLETGGEESCVYNLGVSAETTRSARSRFAAELGARLEDGESPLVLLAYGANDAARRGVAPLVPLDAYLDNLRACVEETRRRRGEALLLTITPVASAADGIPNARGTVRSNALIREYNAALGAFSRERGVEVLDVHAEFARRGPETLFAADGVHPNAAGHGAIFRLIRKRLGFR